MRIQPRKGAGPHQNPIQIFLSMKRSRGYNSLSTFDAFFFLHAVYICHVCLLLAGTMWYPWIDAQCGWYCAIHLYLKWVLHAIWIRSRQRFSVYTSLSLMKIRAHEMRSWRLYRWKFFGVVCTQLKARHRIYISLIMQIFTVAPSLKFLGKSATRTVGKGLICFHEPWDDFICKFMLEISLCSRKSDERWWQMHVPFLGWTYGLRILRIKEDKES